MKLSLNWIFDHIDASTRPPMQEIADRFIKTTAEIEGWKEFTLPAIILTLARVIKIDDAKVVLMSVELNKELRAPLRSDCLIGQWYMMQVGDNEVRWATFSSVGGTKDTLLPALAVNEKEAQGSWKKSSDTHDYIIEVDNKSINHRPDLWGHRGIAREVAAIFNADLIALDQFVTTTAVQQINTQPFSAHTGSFSIAIDDTSVCKQFSALLMDNIAIAPSSVAMAIRLARLDIRPINYVVDCTNYVMLDMGHPMHAFDADRLTAKKVHVRRAQPKEKLALLDGETITLTTDDVVIADGATAVSLAGIMGGGATGVHHDTTSVLLEAAHFDATTIRRTAARYKKRTESSMRFEKSLDFYHISDMIRRYLFLLDQGGVEYHINGELVQLGQQFHAQTISVDHSFIEKRLGIVLEPERVVTILEKLFFAVAVQQPKNDKNNIRYDVSPPSFRMTKDIGIAEDIVEEVGRYVGYDTIERIMPAIGRNPSDLHQTYTIRTIKKTLSSGLSMRELYGYSFFDESFLRTLDWSPDHCVMIKNPISENYTRMVTTLQPHLLKSIGENSIHHKQVRFYEWGRVWSLRDDLLSEKKSLSGAFFDQSTEFDFYAGKSLLEQLFAQLRMTVQWKKNEQSCYPWMVTHQTALLYHDDVMIGCAGLVEQSVVDKLSDASGVIFVFELDGDYLSSYKHEVVRFEPLPKYPSVRRDVSLLVSLAATVDDISSLIGAVDNKICDVVLVDFFTKAEWQNQKALTFHVEMQDPEKTLEHHEVEQLWGRVLEKLQQYGATIR